jgi:hypothetical protein
LLFDGFAVVARAVTLKFYHFKSLSLLQENTMRLHVKRSSLFIALLLVVFTFGCGLFGDTDKANKLVDEGNAATQDANKIASEAEPKYTAVFTEKNLEEFPGNRDQLKGQVQEVIGLLEKAAARYRDAGGKFDEARKLNVDEKFKEYLDMYGQANRKQAEKLDAAKESAQAFLDPSITDNDTLNKKLQSFGERAQKLLQEAKDFESKAKKIQEENKDKFKS